MPFVGSPPKVIRSRCRPVQDDCCYEQALPNEFRSRESLDGTSIHTRTSNDGGEDRIPEFDVFNHGLESNVFAARPEEFAAYFPTDNRLTIKHDDTTEDGNTNLRIDTLAQTRDGSPVDLTLFHLRMYDLKKREVSLRRYCRESGKEVCHTNRKHHKPSNITRAGLQRSVSSVLNS